MEASPHASREQSSKTPALSAALSTPLGELFTLLVFFSSWEFSGNFIMEVNEKTHFSVQNQKMLIIRN